MLEGLSWLEVASPQNQQLVLALTGIAELDLGESEAIALAVERDADYLLMDEMSGRRIALEYKLRVTGVVGILIQAKQRGLIVEVRSEIIRLRERGFWLNPKFVNAILRRVGEPAL